MYNMQCRFNITHSHTHFCIVMYLYSTEPNTSRFIGSSNIWCEYIVVVLSTGVRGPNRHLKPAVNHAKSVSDVQLIDVILQDYCPEALWYCYIVIIHVMTTLQEEESVGRIILYNKKKTT